MAEDESSTNEQLPTQSDNLGSDSNVLLRPMRQLLSAGKPLGPMTVLSFPLPGKGSFPFGVLAWTAKSRLIFWPTIPILPTMAGVIDHVTLEFPSMRSHRTAYSEAGKSIHTSAADLELETAWQLTPFPDSGVALWLSLKFRTETLLNQELAIHRNVSMPTSAEATRRTEEFVRHLQQLNHVDVPLPPDQATLPQYICCNIYITTDPHFNTSLTSQMFMEANLAEHVEGWPDDVPFMIQPLKLDRGGHELIIATACPPGELVAEVFVGIARPKAKPHGNS